MFPDIFTLNQQQRATVAEMWSNQRLSLCFRRPLNDWKIQRVVDFTRSWGNSKELFMHKIVWDGRITIGTISVLEERTKNLILVTVRGMGGHGS